MHQELTVQIHSETIFNSGVRPNNFPALFFNLNRLYLRNVMQQKKLRQTINQAHSLNVFKSSLFA